MNIHPALLAVIICGLAPLVFGQTPTTTKVNLLANPSFEEGQSAWDFSSYHSRGVISVDETETHDGKKSIRIENPSGEDSFLKQTVTVKPKTRYRLTGYIKTKDVVVKGNGATFSLDGGFERTESITGKKSWTKVTLEFETGAATSIKIGPRLGHHGNMAKGVAWFDEVTLIELGPSRKR